MKDKENPGIKIGKNSDFPSQLDSYETKISEEFALQIKRAIESEWFSRYNGTQNCKFYTQKEQLVERRVYAKGLQSMSRPKKHLGINGDLSFLNLSTKPVSVAPKLVNVVCNGFANRDASIKAFGIDDVSQENKVSYRRRIETDMLSKEFLIKAKQELGVDAASMPIDQIPETSQDLDIHMQMEYKPSIEMSEELAIDVVFNENKYADKVESKVRKDLTICGVAWVKNRFVKDKGILIEWVDPENKIQSYTEDPFFDDCFYHGEFKTTLISDVLVEYPWINSYPELQKQLEYSGNNWNGYHDLQDNEKLKGTTNLLYVTYKTTRELGNKIKEKTTGARKVTPINYTKGESKRKDYKIVSAGAEEILFEGVFVLGTDIILKWEVSEYMSRPKSNKQMVINQFIGMAPEREKGYIDSLVARMIPVIDKLDIIELKADQIIQRITPDGYRINVGALADLDLGDGKALTPLEHLDMLLQTGSVFTNDLTSGGEFNYGKDPITELRTGDSLNKLQALRSEREYNLNALRDVIGLNNASDASNPDKDSLVGLQKLAALNSNTATRHILDACNILTKYTAQAITYRLSDLLKYSDLKDDLIRKIGATSVLDLEAVKDLHLYDFAIFLELSPDDEEKAKLEADLSKEIDKGFLGVEDKYKILAIKNLKLATSYLSILKKKRAKLQEEAKMREIEAQTQGNIKSAQAAEQAKQQTAQLEAMVKSELQKMIDSGAISKEVARGEQDRLTETLKAEKQLELQYVVNSGQSEKLERQEEAKEERLLKQATMDSEKINQRSRNGEPIDFEERENSSKIFEM
jgi:hypothetical protein